MGLSAWKYVLTHIFLSNKCRPSAAESRGRMEEKIYKTISGSGALNIAVGVVVLVTGIVSGTLLIIGGAKLLAGRSKILF